MTVKRCGCTLCKAMCIGLTRPTPDLAVKRCGCALCKAMWINLVRPAATLRLPPTSTPTIGPSA